ncbi:MAG TPA: glycoside hydrolase family 43 protein, partial [Solirubrobacteraceae bacterium]|nr:glycoside hydrolase family 43 protein [Solirubrobacteraceae bacterium]
MLRRLRAAALLLAVPLLLAAAAAPARAATFTNPVLPGDYPDPSVVRVGADFYATATSDRWAPVFPVLHSRDLVTWEQVGSVLSDAPDWAGGKRFWAPEITYAHGRFVVLYAGLQRPGRFCIGVATAARAAGPWRDRGPLTCRDSGAIDPVAVRREDGTHWLVWKAKGHGGGLSAQQVDLARLRVLGTALPLIAPERTYERGVTEGPSLVKRGPWWYLVYSGGNCCRPPCTYVTAVARSQNLLGPYEKARRPILESSPTLRCPGHGTLVDLPDGRLFFLHHAYAAADVLNRRRQGVLTRAWVDDDGWLRMGTDRLPDPGGEAPLGGAAAAQQQPGAPPETTFADDFAAPALTPGWQWIIRRDAPLITVGAGELRLGCDTDALVTRQVAADRFEVSVTVLPPRKGADDGTPALMVRERDGAQRGIEVRDGRALAVW